MSGWREIWSDRRYRYGLIIPVLVLVEGLALCAAFESIWLAGLLALLPLLVAGLVIVMQAYVDWLDGAA